MSDHPALYGTIETTSTAGQSFTIVIDRYADVRLYDENNVQVVTPGRVRLSVGSSLVDIIVRSDGEGKCDILSPGNARIMILWTKDGTPWALDILLYGSVSEELANTDGLVYEVSTKDDGTSVSVSIVGWMFEEQFSTGRILKTHTSGIAYRSTAYDWTNT